MANGSRCSIAVVGSGLAGGLLALELKPWTRVTVFEREGPRPTRPAPVRATGAPLGLSQTFGYGLGGTTNLWRGCLLAMRPGEFGEHWPEEVRTGLRPHIPRVVDRLYGRALGQAWRSARAGGGAHEMLDEALAPARPSRLADVGRWCDVETRMGEFVDAVEETSAGVVVRTVGPGGPRRYGFDAVVIAAGALNAPLLLQRSALGNANVGKNLTDHPMGLIAKVALSGDPDMFARMSSAGPWSPVAKFQDVPTGLWTSFQLCPTHDLAFDRDRYPSGSTTGDAKPSCFSSLRRGFRNPEYRALLAGKALGRPRLGRHAYVLAMCEQETRGQGNVRQAADGGIDLDWRISDQVVAATQRSLERFAAWLEADLHLPPEGIRHRLWSGAHHSGACRISRDGAHGVVNADLTVHGTSRIYVCDGSVLPSTGASNTGLTIGALSLRLAAHLQHVYG